MTELYNSNAHPWKPVANLYIQLEAGRAILGTQQKSSMYMSLVHGDEALLYLENPLKCKISLTTIIIKGALISLPQSLQCPVKFYVETEA